MDSEPSCKIKPQMRKTKGKVNSYSVGSDLVEGNASLRVSTVHMVVFQMLLNLLPRIFYRNKNFLEVPNSKQVSCSNSSLVE
jgi:hypothetical protein